MTHGVVVVIERAGKFLFGKRSPHKKAAPLYWCPVTGKIEAGESQEQAVVREALEETGLRVEPLRKIAEFPTRAGDIRLHWWTVRLLDGSEPRPNHEHTELRWVTLEELCSLAPVFEEDIAVIEQLARSRAD